MQIIRKIDDLNREIFRFTWFDRTLVLDGYSLEYKESTRHKKWLTLNKYERLQNRDCKLSFEDVPLTDDIISKALEEGRQSINYKTWEEYKLW